MDNWDVTRTVYATWLTLTVRAGTKEHDKPIHIRTDHIATVEGKPSTCANILLTNGHYVEVRESVKDVMALILGKSEKE